MSAELQVAAAELDRRHLVAIAGEKRATDLIHQLLQDHGGDQLAVCDRLSDDCIGLVLADGTRFYLTSEAC